MNYEEFKSKSISLLDFTFMTLIALTVIGGVFYFSVLQTNVQNTLPIIFILFLTFFSWVFRSKIQNSTEAQFDEIRQTFQVWFGFTVVSILFIIMVIFVYPIS